MATLYSRYRKCHVHSRTGLKLTVDSPAIRVLFPDQLWVKRLGFGNGFQIKIQIRSGTETYVEFCIVRSHQLHWLRRLRRFTGLVLPTWKQVDHKQITLRRWIAPHTSTMDCPPHYYFTLPDTNTSSSYRAHFSPFFSRGS